MAEKTAYVVKMAGQAIYVEQILSDMRVMLTTNLDKALVLPNERLAGIIRYGASEKVWGFTIAEVFVTEHVTYRREIG